MASSESRTKRNSSKKQTATKSSIPEPEPLSDAEESAKAAGLRYVTDSKPGIRREQAGEKNFRFFDASGKKVKDEKTLARIKSLVIPPAWTDVWICPVANGHLQVTGRDARGRKQSRYHPKWRETRDETKYEHMMQFADALPAIRKHVAADLAKAGLPREKVLATVVSVMEQTHIRVGNEEYAKQNKSYGLTTMRNKHARVDGSTITFDFQGKSKVHHTINLQDRRLARIIKRCEELPGYELFQYVDEGGMAHSIDSNDVNEYLCQITGEHFTAKDFRTWAGTVMTCDLLRALEPYETAAQAKKNVVAVIKEVASKLGNTPSVCRKSYVHPAVLESYLGGITKDEARKEIDQEIATHQRALHEEERAVVKLLEQRKLLDKAA